MRLLLTIVLFIANACGLSGKKAEQENKGAAENSQDVMVGIDGDAVIRDQAQFMFAFDTTGEWEVNVHPKGENEWAWQVQVELDGDVYLMGLQTKSFGELNTQKIRFDQLVKVADVAILLVKNNVDGTTYTKNFSDKITAAPTDQGLTFQVSDEKVLALLKRLKPETLTFKISGSQQKKEFDSQIKASY